MHDWEAVCERRARYEDKANECPYCYECEDVVHMFGCVAHNKEQNIASIQKKMKKLRIAPAIMAALIQLMFKETCEKPIIMNKFDAELCQAITKQETIGHKQVKYGRISKKWYHAQCEFDKYNRTLGTK